MGISLRTVARMSQESRKPDIHENPNTSVIKYGPREKPKTADLWDTTKMEIRNVIYNMYSESKFIPTATIDFVSVL